MAVIFWLSSFPRFEFVPDRWQIEPVSLTVHALEYGLLAALLWRAAQRTPALSCWSWQASLLITLLYAASDEVHQAFVPGRYADVRDWLADAAGAAVAVWLLQRRAQVSPARGAARSFRQTNTCGTMPPDPETPRTGRKAHRSLRKGDAA